MKDWFDEWLNSPNNEHLPKPPDDLDRDGLFQDSPHSSKKDKRNEN